MIIGMLGWIGCGKGTAADYFKNRGFVNESFAGPLKDAVSEVFGWPRDLLEGDTKESREFREQLCEFWSKELKRDFTPREALQRIGTEVFRDAFYQDIWVASMRKRLREHKEKNRNVIISDVRFKNEVKMLREEDAALCWVRRGENPEWYDTAETANLCPTDCRELIEMETGKYSHIHRSEWDWIGCHINHVIFNESTLKDFHARLDVLYQLELDKQAQIELQSTNSV